MTAAGVTDTSGWDAVSIIIQKNSFTPGYTCYVRKFRGNVQLLNRTLYSCESPEEAERRAGEVLV